MTEEKFIQSFGYHKAGDKGYCRLASFSTKKDKIIYDLGFWFEIIRKNGNVLILSVQLKSLIKETNRNTILFNGKSHLENFIEDLRQKTQDEVCSFFSFP